MGKSKTSRKQDKNSEPRPEDESMDAQNPAGENSEQTPEQAGPPLSPLEQAQAERDEYLANFQRAKADYQNLRRRILEDIDAAVMRKTNELMHEMLTVLDYLDMALASPCESQDSKNLLVGVQMTRGQLWQSLERQGVQVIQTEGAFDPTKHQAMATVDRDDVPPGTIVEVVRGGFRKGDHILRPAQVKVSAEPGAQESSASEAQDAAE